MLLGVYDFFLRHENVITTCDFFQGGVEKELKGRGVGMGDRRITSQGQSDLDRKISGKSQLHGKILSKKRKEGKKEKGREKKREERICSRIKCWPPI